MTISTPVRQRTATADVTLSTGRAIKAGQTVSMHFIPANAEPKHFGERGEEFNPHRQVEGTAPWGLALDPSHPPMRDTSTHYALYSSIPVRFTRI